MKPWLKGGLIAAAIDLPIILLIFLFVKEEYPQTVLFVITQLPAIGILLITSPLSTQLFEKLNVINGTLATVSSIFLGIFGYFLIGSILGAIFGKAKKYKLRKIEKKESKFKHENL